MSEGMWRSASEFVRCGMFDGDAFISKRGNDKLNITFYEERNT